MSDLRLLCEEAGFRSVRTYIASGNVLLASSKPAAKVKSTIEASLLAYAGKAVGVVVFTPIEMVAVLTNNPFADRDPARTVAIFLDEAPPKDTITSAKGRSTEEIVLGERVIYVHYADGIAGSKLKLPAAAHGTARNMNTVAALVKLTSPDVQNAAEAL
jgi:uncharacterized protein (DUF1697 family)